jgi:hypothetical protein
MSTVFDAVTFDSFNSLLGSFLQQFSEGDNDVRSEGGLPARAVKLPLTCTLHGQYGNLVILDHTMSSAFSSFSPMIVDGTGTPCLSKTVRCKSMKPFLRQVIFIRDGGVFFK